MLSNYPPGVREAQPVDVIRERYREATYRCGEGDLPPEPPRQDIAHREVLWQDNRAQRVQQGCGDLAEGDCQVPRVYVERDVEELRKNEHGEGDRDDVRKVVLKEH